MCNSLKDYCKESKEPYNTPQECVRRHKTPIRRRKTYARPVSRRQKAESRLKYAQGAARPIKQPIKLRKRRKDSKSQSNLSSNDHRNYIKLMNDLFHKAFKRICIKRVLILIYYK